MARGRNKLIVSVLLLALILLIQSWDSPITRASEGEPIKMGVLAAFSGPASAWGLAVLHCIEMWADEVNASGGLEVNGVKHKIELIKEDTKFDAATANAGAEKLIYKDGVKFIHGTVGSHTTAAILSTTTPAKVINLHYGWLKDLIDPKYPYSFGAMPTAHEWAEPMYLYFREAFPDKKRVVLLARNYSGGHAVVKDVEPAVKATGRELVKTIFYEPKTQDFYPTVTKALSYKPDIVDMTIANTGEAGALLKTLKQLGYTGITTQQTQSDPATLISIAGAAANGHFFVGGGTDKVVATEKMRKYIAEYTKRYKAWNEASSQELYPPVVLAKAIQAAGTYQDNDKVAKALQEVNFASDYVKGNPKVYFTGEKFYGRKARLIVPICLTRITDGAAGTVKILKPRD